METRPLAPAAECILATDQASATTTAVWSGLSPGRRVQDAPGHTLRPGTRLPPGSTVPPRRRNGGDITSCSRTEVVRPLIAQEHYLLHRAFAPATASLIPAGLVHAGPIQPVPSRPVPSTTVPSTPVPARAGHRRAWMRSLGSAARPEREPRPGPLSIHLPRARRAGSRRIASARLHVTAQQSTRPRPRRGDLEPDQRAADRLLRGLNQFLKQQPDHAAVRAAAVIRASRG